ncbi:hypothetical protein CLU79DRAFT_361178 [Phycomyces nitens]|nr:hypothetical protein CLU79DRAFT_361178 [Phycomyces nitens]
MEEPAPFASKPLSKTLSKPPASSLESPPLQNNPTISTSRPPVPKPSNKGKEKATEPPVATVDDTRAKNVLEKRSPVAFRSPTLEANAFTDEENDFPMFDEPIPRKSFIEPLPPKKYKPAKKTKPVKNIKDTSMGGSTLKKRRKLSQRPVHNDISTRGSVSPMTKWLNDN